MTEPEKFDCWAIVEVMGHSKYAGRVTEQAIGGCAFVRVDVTEDIARGMAKQLRNKPVSVYDLTSAATQPGVMANIDDCPSSFVNSGWSSCAGTTKTSTTIPAKFSNSSI